FFFILCFCALHVLHSFPTRRSSDLVQVGDLLVSSGMGGVFPSGYPVGRIAEVNARPGQSFAEVTAEPASKLDRDRAAHPRPTSRDRKSTRLNSSHVKISYAVFCLKK